ncbi:MAG TPA: hypothetical protein VHZ07_10870 [Bryobacteraceae bacterium]|nr:hypothetical protein [Bryobacteraceae bacterium]
MALSSTALPAIEATPYTVAIDLRRLVSRGDLICDKPASRSEAGIPVGNGRMGTLVWTTPQELRMQINRVDVYANNAATHSFIERNDDYCGGCAFVDLDFGAGGGDVFPLSGFAQHLSLYDGALSIQANGVTAQMFGWPTRDVMAIEVDGPRMRFYPLNIRLRMLRYDSKYFPPRELETFARDHFQVVKTRSQTAASQLHIQDNRIALTQEFREASFCCKSAVAIAVIGRATNARFANETEVSLGVTPGASAVQILIASAATFDPNEDVLAKAMRDLDAADSKTLPVLRQETSDWWRHFWSAGFVHLHSEDGEADFVERNYTYFLYLMASTSRGAFPPKFNGMLWNTAGDLRTWGAQHWFANLSCYYEALPASNRLELTDPMYRMYSGMYDACSVAARQEWGSQGMYTPETTYFDGLAKLPDDIANEMQDLYLLRKPWHQRSDRFIEFSHYEHPHSSRWNWIAKGEYVDGHFVETERGFGPYGNVSHILGSNAKIAYLYWQRYEFTLDRDWLSDRAYPMLRAAVEFYRNFPNLKKGADGRYHIHWVNSNESVWGARDTDEDLSAMRGVLAALIRAATILKRDAGMLPVWTEFRDNLAPLPASDDSEALKPESYSGPRVWVRGLRPAIKAAGFLPDGNSLPQWFFDLCTLESNDKQTIEVAQNTLHALLKQSPGPQTPVGLLSKLPIAAAVLGHAEMVKFLIPNQLRALPGSRNNTQHEATLFPNRMSLREGPQALEAEALGRASEALHTALLQSTGPGPAEEPVIHVFPAWPKGWNAAYQLRARGAFLVTTSIQDGNISFVQIKSLAGAECRLRNPWGEDEASLYRATTKAETMEGPLLRFPTAAGEIITIVRSGVNPVQAVSIR